MGLCNYPKDREGGGSCSSNPSLVGLPVGELAFRKSDHAKQQGSLGNFKFL